MTDALAIRGSLRKRLAYALTGAAAVLAILLFVVVRSYAARIAQDGQDAILGASVTSILDAAVLRNGLVEIDFPYAAFSMLTTPSDDRVFYAIWRDDTLLSGYDTLPRAAQSDSGFRTVVVDGVPVRAADATRTLIGSDVRTQVTVSVAQTLDDLSGTLNQISRTVAGFGLGFFVLASLLSIWATSTTIGQLKRLSTSVARRGPQDLRPFEQPVPVEMAPLVGSLNSLMGRLDQSLQQSEDFIAEAAHRVRTPLATVRSYAEVTLQRVDKQENRDSLRAMVRAIDESSRAAGQLLDHAMITFRTDHLQREPIDMVELVTDLVQRLTPVAEMRDVEFALTHDPRVTVQGDPILVQNALRNLIDNALKYAPEETTIRIGVTAGPQPSVTIRDEGPGFPPDEIDTLAHRFVRGRNAGATIGSGLGLTIARDVAVAHGGSLTLSNNPEGGACAFLSF
ncbi:sensor histidine kinase [Sulfitobacter sp. S190]|uniref:sensor histidine kinase n=1 Tax=Sulfitobacter sp. S190 TaxID=2867022 RepID=UPI0021A30477|nr:sensor histidine kinase [Sulfitobacter sp. S190]UWR21858.1 sensor histidine kinase [Sulfitobacter sp. S190]